MLKRAVLALAVVAVASCDEPTHAHKHIEPLAAVDKHITHSLAHHLLWPWNQLLQAAAVLDEDCLEEPKIVSDSEKYQVILNVKRFKPEELTIRVKNRNIIVKGEHNETNKEGVSFVADRFIQRFILPPGSKEEEVTAVLSDNETLTITVPRHELPPPPEKEVPIEVVKSEKKDEDRTVTPELEQQKTRTTTHP